MKRYPAGLWWQSDNLTTEGPMAAMIKPPAVITPKHATVELWPTSGSTVFAGGAAGF
jgi:hypothetical protein